MRITRVGGPTILVELHGWRILVDPTFDPPGQRYAFGLGTSSVKTMPPAVALADVAPVDIVLASHDHHADNLDNLGRTTLATAGHVVTTRPGARRIGLANTRGLVAGESTSIDGAGKDTVEITATPCRHGPPLSRPIVGEVIGFAIRRPGTSTHDLWITGDTVRYRAVRKTARTLRVDVAVVNAGGVRFPLTGPVDYSMRGRDAVRLVRELAPRVAIPAHYDGWSHFKDGETGMRTAIEQADPTTRDRFRWLPDGTPVDI